MQTFIARTPTRVDLAGGTLDIWPIPHLLEQKCTVNIAVDAWAIAEVQVLSASRNEIELISEDQRENKSYQNWKEIDGSSLPLLGLLIRALWQADLPGLRLSTRAISPKGAGLGGSSALAIAIIRALTEAKRHLGMDAPWDEDRAVDLAKNVEARIIQAPTGIQDYWAAVRGGINVIQYPPSGPVVSTREPGAIRQLAQRMLLVYCGASRDSAMNNWTIFRNVFERDPKTLELMSNIGALAQRCGDAVMKGDLDAALAASKEEWQQRLQLWPTIINPEFKRIEAQALDQGAHFARFCGAGGGGVMAVFGAPDRMPGIAQACRGAGGQLIDFEVAEEGAKIL